MRAEPASCCLCTYRTRGHDDREASSRRSRVPIVPRQQPRIVAKSLSHGAFCTGYWSPRWLARVGVTTSAPGCCVEWWKMVDGMTCHLLSTGEDAGVVARRYERGGRDPISSAVICGALECDRVAWWKVLELRFQIFRFGPQAAPPHPGSRQFTSPSRICLVSLHLEEGGRRVGSTGHLPERSLAEIRQQRAWPPSEKLLSRRHS